MKTMEAPRKESSELKSEKDREKELREFIREVAVSVRKGEVEMYPAEEVMAEMRAIIKQK